MKNENEGKYKTHVFVFACVPVSLVEGEVLVQNRFVCLSMMVGLVHRDALGDFSVKRWYI